MSVETR